MDCSLPGSSIHGIFQARVLEWGAIPVTNLLLFISKVSLHHSTVMEMTPLSISPFRGAPYYELPVQGTRGTLSRQGLFFPVSVAAPLLPSHSRHMATSGGRETPVLLIQTA